MNTLRSVSKRQIAAVVCAAALAMAAPRVSGQAAADETLKSTFLMELTLEIGAPQNLGERHIYPFTGGRFEGPRLKGIVLPAGGDWMVMNASGFGVMDERATLRTDDNELIYVTMRGVSYSPKGGERYTRVSPVFETASPKYDWLNRMIAVGVNTGVTGKVVYRIYQIL